VSVRLSVILSPAGIVSKQLDESSWILAWMLPSTYATGNKENNGYPKDEVSDSRAAKQA